MWQAQQPRTVAQPAPQGDREPVERRVWRALGTTCEVQFPASAGAAGEVWAREAQAWVAAFEAKYSRYRADSLLSRINAEAGRGWVEIDAETERYLDLCGSLHFMTRGALDPTSGPLLRLWNYQAPQSAWPTDEEVETARRLVGWAKVERRAGQVRLPLVGMALDFGGWGKEWAVDAAWQLAAKHGLNSVLVDFGHDLRAGSPPPGKPAWHVGIEDPDLPGTARTSLAVWQKGVASSGDYLRFGAIGGRRFGHIVDPRTGRPVTNGCRQVTVLAASCLQAGVLSTAAFVLGATEGLRLVQETMGAEALIITDKARYQSRGFFNYVVQDR